MYMIYSNSKDLLISLVALPSCLSLETEKGKVLITPENVDLYRDELARVLSSDPFSFLLYAYNMKLVFVYTEGDILRRCTMSEYDSSYTLSATPEIRSKELSKIALPFFPEQYMFTDRSSCDRRKFSEAQEKRYQHILNKKAPDDCTVKEVCRIINAASDDLDGDLAFSHFAKVLNIDPEIIYRCRPQSLLADSFASSVVTGSKPASCEKLFAHIADAMDLRTFLDADVETNVSLKLQSRQPPDKCHIGTAIGRLDAAILGLIYARKVAIHEDTKADNYVICLTCKAKNGNEIVLTSTDCYKTKVEAEEVARQVIANSIPVVIHAVQFHMDPKIPIKLYNEFDLQRDACRYLHLHMERVAECEQWLFRRGYITWPNDTRNFPFHTRKETVKAIGALRNAWPEYRQAITQSAADAFAEYDDERPGDEGRDIIHSGIQITSRILPKENLSIDTYNDILSIYRLIANREIMVMVDREAKTTAQANGSADSKLYTAEQTLSFPVSKKDAYESQYVAFAQLAPQEKLQPVKYDVILKRRPGCNVRMTESEVIDEFISKMGSKGYNLLCNDMQFISKPVVSLLRHKLAVRMVDGQLRITQEGYNAMTMLKNTPLASLSDTLEWDARLKAISEQLTAYKHPFLGRAELYVRDILLSMDEDYQKEIAKKKAAKAR